MLNKLANPSLTFRARPERGAAGAILVLAALVLATPGLAAGVKTRTIHLKDGVHTAPIDVRGDGNTRVAIVGNVKHPENVILEVKGASPIRVRKAIATVSGVELRSDQSFPQLLAEENGEIDFSNVRFGLGGQHVTAGPGGRVRATGNYDVVVGGVSHLHARGGVIDLKSNVVVTLHNAAFLAFFAGANKGGLVNIEPGVSFSGLASTTKFHVRDHGRINSGGLGIAGLPGGRPGVIEDTGEYDTIHASR